MRRGIILKPQINQTLSKLDLHPANVPIGVWVYGPMENDPAPLIEKAVILMETFGDKRFETHLLSGLEILADQLITDSSASLVIQAVKKAFGNKSIPSISNLGASRALKLTQNKVNPYATSHIGSLAGDKILEISHDKLIELGFTPTQTILQEINNISPKEPTINIHGTEIRISALVKLFARLGFECGRAVRVVHSTAPGFLWGTYQDFANYQLHCNAHANNLIVLPLDIISEKKQILSPLDFDMAFSSETSINFWKRSPVADPTFVTDSFNIEVFEMMNDLGGIYVSGDWAKIKDVKQRPLPENEDKQNIIWLLRDVMIWEHFIGYSNPTGGPTEDAIPAPTLPSDAEWPMIIEMINHALSLSDHLHS
ncbi:MAG: hypothetical protein EZS28_036681 [Streblomastix strix]|uniref:Uncharacterized protein n=1 Tax=Streblomastix strix TaxID=222440 RepID=A0A5J4UCA1_9EUKA|nr:MAG: hypothetical protein EZS28_036681 [Streblomastix strix]